MSFAKVGAVKVGDKLIADGGFTCIKEGDVKEVKSCECGGLYIDCQNEEDGADGKHFLIGQVDKNGEYAGLTLAS